MNIIKDPKKLPPRIVAYGPEGIGKSTLGANAPRPVFIPTEDGLREIKADRFPLCTDFQQVYQATEELLHEPHDYDTVVIDSLDWLERLIFDDLCRTYNCKGIEKVDGGYARGYTHALDYWRPFLMRLDELNQKRGMIVICLAHAKVEKVEDPECQAYSRNMPRLHKLAAGLIVEWADAVLFCTRKFRVEQEDAGFNRKRNIAQAIGADGGERIIRANTSPACVAKSRYKIPDGTSMEWEKIFELICKAQS